MGVEGAPEGPEDPIAQICITVGKVRRLVKKTRAQILREERFSFSSLSFFLSLSKSTTAAKDKKSLLVLVLVLVLVLLLSCRVKNRV